MNETVFWLVWAPNSGYAQKRHEYESFAIAEAKRLASQNTEQPFYVLKAISRFEAIDRPRPVAETMLMEPR